MKLNSKLNIVIFVFLTFMLNKGFANSDSTCIADFSYEVYQELGKPSVIQFINQSTGEPSQYNWDFGDGSSSGIKNPIHYFPENGNFQVKLSVSNSTSSDEMIQNIEINVSLSIDFSFKLDSINIVPNTFIFSSIIEGYYDYIYWNFGDQIIQNVEDTIHSYAKENYEYQVSFSAQYDFNDTSALSKTLSKGLSTSEYFNLGGQVFLGDSLMNNPINKADTGIAYLFLVNDDQLIPIDTNIFHNLGYYWFDKKLKAHYIIQVSLTEGSNHTDEFAPTYMGNTTYWDEAEIINLTQNKYREDISLLEKSHKKSGTIQLTGDVNDLIDIDNEESILICLYNTEYELIDYQYKYAFSSYEFNELEKGYYLIGADIPGKYSRSQLIFADENIQNGFKSLDEINENSIFPNPAKNYTLFSYQNTLDLQQLVIQIYHSNGKLLQTNNYHLKSGSNYIHLDLEGMPSGILYLKFKDTDSKIMKLLHY